MASMSTRSLRAVALVVWLVAGAGCTQTKSFVHDKVPVRPAGTVEVLLLEPDIELSEITAAGLLIPKADWTQRARDNVLSSLGNLMETKDATIVHFEPPADATRDSPYTQLLKLHEAVGYTILTHKYNQALALPNKKDTFDWTLGPTVSVLQETYDADYALFIFFRDSFSSAGRVALMVVGAVFGVGVPGGAQIGFASLVDLNSGDILWFNRLFSEVGDLRKPNSADEAIASLLQGLPL